MENADNLKLQVEREVVELPDTEILHISQIVSQRMLVAYAGAAFDSKRLTLEHYKSFVSTCLNTYLAEQRIDLDFESKVLNARKIHHKAIELLLADQRIMQHMRKIIPE